MLNAAIQPSFEGLDWHIAKGPRLPIRTKFYVLLLLLLLLNFNATFFDLSTKSHRHAKLAYQSKTVKMIKLRYQQKILLTQTTGLITIPQCKTRRRHWLCILHVIPTLFCFSHGTPSLERQLFLQPLWISLIPCTHLLKYPDLVFLVLLS